MNYTCPKCNKLHSSNQWDDSTKVYYNANCICSVEEGSWDSFFICPSCGEEVSYDNLISNSNGFITITKQEYKELLEIKAMYEGLCK